MADEEVVEAVEAVKAMLLVTNLIKLEQHRMQEVEVEKEALEAVEEVVKEAVIEVVDNMEEEELQEEEEAGIKIVKKRLLVLKTNSICFLEPLKQNLNPLQRNQVTLMTLWIF